jgi:type VI secretion system secreted protein Hcp
VDGESSDAAHSGWIEVLSIQHSLRQPARWSDSAKQYGASRCEHGDFVVVKTLDRASPRLALLLCRGEVLKSATLELCRAANDKQKYMEYQFTDAIITSITLNGTKDSSSIPTETVSLTYRKVQWTYFEAGHRAGEPKGRFATSWDLTLRPQ